MSTIEASCSKDGLSLPAEQPRTTPSIKCLVVFISQGLAPGFGFLYLFHRSVSEPAQDQNNVRGRRTKSSAVPKVQHSFGICLGTILNPLRNFVIIEICFSQWFVAMCHRVIGELCRCSFLSHGGSRETGFERMARRCGWARYLMQ